MLDPTKDTALQPTTSPAPAAPAGGPGAGGRLGQYVLLAQVGQGGMGTVYKALHTRLKRVVALKVLPERCLGDPVAVARFGREMEAVGKLDHPHLVRASDAGEADGQHFLVMDYVEGPDLHRLVQQLGPLPVPEACELVRQAALGLQYVHEHGLVHRDVKPSNLMVTTAGQVKVLDLGLARLAEEPRASERLTDSNQVMGTADYMAPEQGLDSHAVDIRADVYALGCTLYKLLTGHAPFSGPAYDSRFKKMLGHAQHAVPPLRDRRPDVHAALAALLDRLLAKAAADRPAVPALVAEQLLPFAAGADLAALVARLQTGQPEAGVAPETGPDLPHTPASAGRAASTSTRTRDRRRLGARLAAGAALLLVLAGAAALLTWRPRPPAPPAVAPDTWHNLLDQAPDELDWDDALREHFKWSYDARSKELWVACTALGLLRLGQAPAPRYQLEVAVQQNDWTGGVGLFFGYHDVPSPTGYGKKYQSVELRSLPPVNGQPTFVLVRELLVLRNRQGGSGTTVASASLPRPTPGEHRLGIAVGPGGLERVTWDGRDVPDLATPKGNARFQAADYQGALGVVNRNATSVFRNARFLFSESEPHDRPN